MSRYQVEYDFVETKHGLRPMWMRGFDTREEAEEFARTKDDANIVEIESAWTFDETGKKIILW